MNANGSKNFVESRRVQGTASGIGAVLAGSPEVGKVLVGALGIPPEYSDVAQTGVQVLLGIVSIVRFALHFTKKDPRKVVLGKSTDGFVFVLPLIVLLSGCASFNRQAMEFLGAGTDWTREDCATLRKPIDLADGFVCSQEMGEDTELNKQRCYHSAMILYHSGVLACIELSDPDPE